MYRYSFLRWQRVVLGSRNQVLWEEKDLNKALFTPPGDFTFGEPETLGSTLNLHWRVSMRLLLADAVNDPLTGEDGA